MTAGELLIAHISDTHLGHWVRNGVDDNKVRLDLVLDHLCSMTRLPDALLVVGDLADAGGEEAYESIRQRFARCPFPVHVALGNHDERASALAVFDHDEGGFMQYAVDIGDLRLIVIDTLEEGRHGGAFCEARASWLRDTLRTSQDRSVLVALHHAPVDTGLDWMTTSAAEPWLARLDSALRESKDVVALLAGHVHRPMVASRGGIPVLVCPSVSSELTLDLADLSPDRPDGRALVDIGPPGYALHLWRDGSLLSHFDFVEDKRTVFSFDQKAQPFMRSLFAERAD